MLTLGEAIIQINLLDTPKDVITQACENVLGLKQNKLDPTKSKTERAIIIRNMVIEALPDEEEPGIILAVLAETIGVIASMSLKPNNYDVGIRAIIDVMVKALAQGAKTQFEKDMKEDPVKAMDDFMEMLQSLGKLGNKPNPLDDD